ncbi:hypothetical protein WJX72_005234 [[Myrmecia] bisecta]|uniref:F-box domain-containing protein n=1 Tax=[Myrmecia] bisecta TaxID=41462 RepID=A0AAW1R6G9_9CHLO
MHIRLDTLPQGLLHEVFKRVPCSCKRHTLPRVCKTFAHLLADPPLPGLWDAITLDFYKLEERYGTDRFLKNARIVSSIQWLADRCAGIERSRVEAISEERVVAVLAVLVGGFAAAPRSPVFELCIPGDDRCPILCSDVFEERLFQAQFLPKIQVNVIHNLK